MRTFPLQIVLDLAERQAESQSRLVKQTYVGWLNTRTQIVRLQQRQQHDVQALGVALQQGCSSAIAQLAAAAAHARQTELITAREMENRAKQAWQRVLHNWQQENKRVMALKVLATRHQQMQNKLEERRESRLHDELSQRSAHAAQAFGGGDAGLMLVEQATKDKELFAR